MRSRVSLLILVLITALAAGCGGESTTDPGANAQLTIVLVAAGAPTVQQAKLFFDGREVASASAPAGAFQFVLQSTVSDTRGPHTLRVVIVQQTASPSPYVIGGGVTLENRILDLAPVQGLVATGQALEMQVSF